MSIRLCLPLLLSSAALAQPSYPESAPTPRSLTPAEADYLRDYPIQLPQAVTPPPTGPVQCPGEYEPMDGIILAWEGPTDWLNIVASMAAFITTDGNANAYVVIDAVGEQQAATSAITARAGNLSRVKFVSRTIDTIWIRDYGPRYIYEGAPGRQVRAIVDHTYNRPRPSDDTFDLGWVTFKKHTYYELPLIHGGGNYHLNSLTRSFATRLTINENPTKTEPQIIGIWHDYQNVDTHFFTPFPTSVDSTQHLDMWMQVIGDSACMVSRWDANAGSQQDTICNDAAVYMQSQGFTVHRLPARSIGGVHYTYTNVVMCNNLVLLPRYANATMLPLNDQALATWQAAVPGKVVRQIDCESIVSSAGVMHCIAMHVPAFRGAASNGGQAPTIFLRSLRGGQTVAPGQQVTLNWISDDDEAVANIDIYLSRDGGATFPTRLANHVPDTGSFIWTVGDYPFAPNARLRIIARDAAGREGDDLSDTDFTIDGEPCPSDFNRDGQTDFFDYLDFVAAFSAEDPSADFDGNGQVDFFDYLEFVAAYDQPC
jgi:agmatine/peptidylarginine deiminase